MIPLVIKALVRPPIARLAAGAGGLQAAAHRAATFGRFYTWQAQHPCREFPNRLALYADVIQTLSRLGELDAMTYLEFGVHKGDTVRWWAEHVAAATYSDDRFIGFDSFEGLPEDWGDLPAGTFSTNGRVPIIPDPRVSFVKGWFSKSLRAFVAQEASASPGILDRRVVVHLDADLYSSTLCALMAIAPFLKPGDILLFDEFGDYMDEFRALNDAADAYNLRYTAFAHTPEWTQVALRIEANGATE